VSSPIPKDLRRPHPLVISTRNNYERAALGVDGRLAVRPRAGVARLLVSKSQLRRALLVLQGLLVDAERRGYQVRSVEEDRYRDKPGVAVVAAGHDYLISIMELTKPVPLAEDDIANWRKENRYRLTYEPTLQPPATKPVPSGTLRLMLLDRWDGGRKNWTEGPRGDLGTKFDSFFAEIDRRAIEDTERSERREREEAERERRQAERLERVRLEKIEQARAEKLLEQVTAWRRARDVRDYSTELRKLVEQVSPDARERIIEWLDWANAWADRIDPLLRPEITPSLDGNPDPYAMSHR
jgi:hypothetical protein